MGVSTMAAAWIPPAWPDDAPALVDVGRAPFVLLVDDAGIYVRRVTWRQRLQARLHADSLDRELAAGVPPESDVLVAVRAGRLARGRTRENLARCVERLLDASRTYGDHRTRRSIAVLPRIACARADLEALVELLRAPAPLSARGVAHVSLLLRDGSGPMYRYESTADLGALVRRIAAELDPSQDWPGEVCR
jgi:hypothetical protein